MTNIINFGNSPASTHARTPANRGRGKTTLSHSHAHSHPPSQANSASPPPADYSSSVTPSMDFGPRAERTPKQGLGHSFTFSTPQSIPSKTTGRKRARTLEYPTDSGNADDDAKVKGGHSLRKRARIDYAQMNEDDDHTHTHPTEDPLEITVSGARAARKRKSIIDQNSEEPEEQPQPPPAAVAQKKRTRTDKQRTASPVPQRRPYTKRKSTAPSVPVEEPSPEQQQSSDTELKDTIEVGAPLAMQFTSSSSNGQPSDTASNISGQSPSRNSNVQQVIAPPSQVASPPAMRTETEATIYSSEGTSSAPPVEGDLLVEHVTHHSPLPIVDSPKKTLDGDQENNENTSPSHTSSVDQEPLQASPRVVSGEDVSGTAEVSDPTKVAKAGIKTPQDQEATLGFQSNSLTADSQQASQPVVPPKSEPAPQPSSQESTDSDATEIVPPTLIKPPAISPEPEQSVSQPTKLTLRKSKQTAPTVESQPQEEEAEEAQDAQKPSLRPRVSSPDIKSCLYILNKCDY